MFFVHIYIEKGETHIHVYVCICIHRIFLEGFSQAGNSRGFRVNRGQGNCIKGIRGGMSIISVRLKKIVCVYL